DISEGAPGLNPYPVRPRRPHASKTIREGGESEHDQEPHHTSPKLVASHSNSPRKTSSLTLLSIARLPSRTGPQRSASSGSDSLRNEHLELIVPKNGTVSLRPRYFTRSSKSLSATQLSDAERLERSPSRSRRVLFLADHALAHQKRLGHAD